MTSARDRGRSWGRRPGQALALLVAAGITVGCTTPVPSRTPDPARSDAAALHATGRTLARQGDLLKAEQYMSLAVRAGYPAIKALPGLVRVCLRASRLRAALMHAQPVLEAHPDSPPLRYLVATLHLGLGQTAQARQHLEILAVAPHPHADARELLTRLDAALPPPTRSPDARR